MDSTSHSDASHRPHHSAPGTLLQQFTAIGLFCAIDPEVRDIDPDGLWQWARTVAIPHARPSREAAA